MHILVGNGPPVKKQTQSVNALNAFLNISSDTSENINSKFIEINVNNIKEDIDDDYQKVKSSSSFNEIEKNDSRNKSANNNDRNLEDLLDNIGISKADRFEMSTEFFVIPTQPDIHITNELNNEDRFIPRSGLIMAPKSSNLTPVTITTNSPNIPQYPSIVSTTVPNGLRREPWVVPILVLAMLTMIMMAGFEIFVLFKAWRTSPSRRHLFLGQMLLFGLFISSGFGALITSTPTSLSCGALRFGIGVSYAIVFSTLLVKCVFLISLNSGVYLPAPYQGLLLLFAVLIQVAIGAQWLLTQPPEIHMLTVPVNTIKSRGIRDNYREATYIGLAVGGAIPIWLGWTFCGLAVADRHKDSCIGFGLVATSATIFLVMFMPKGRQLAAMGKEGFYVEDREDRFSSLSRAGSGYSPSFFHFKPIKYGVIGQVTNTNSNTGNGGISKHHHVAANTVTSNNNNGNGPG
uniref:G-protein coupled receptors family 3 profile domain-containing protein n=1 Tax=Megaselia scalaris TaxID=36166 RepID=T1GGZ3_MEGSC